jgi:hypothetical protein
VKGNKEVRGGGREWGGYRCWLVREFEELFVRGIGC